MAKGNAANREKLRAAIRKANKRKLDEDEFERLADNYNVDWSTNQDDAEMLIKLGMEQI